MAKQRDHVDPKSRKKGFFSPFFKPLGWFFSTISYVSIALVISIIVEWIGISFFWPTDHASLTLAAELDYLGNNFSTSVADVSPAQLAVNVATWTKSLLTENDFVLWFSVFSISEHNNSAMRFAATFVNVVAIYMESAVFVAMVVSVRLTVVLLSSLVIILVTFVSALDGLIERELRHVGGDIEHSKIVHQAMYWAPKLAFFAPIAYLAWPWVANPVFFFVPAMLLYGYTNYLVFSQYQKRF